MLFAIGRPAAFAGLLVGFLLALALRVVAMRVAARALGLAGSRDPLLPSPREDVDPFGAVSAAVAGPGWGRAVDIDLMPRLASRGRKAAVVAAGPLATIVAGLAALTAHRTLFAAGDPVLGLVGAGSLLRGAGLDDSFAGAFLLGLAVELLCFGLLALIPLPPLDGFALLWFAMRTPGVNAQKARLWLAENNIGVVILIALSFLPLSAPLLHLFVGLLAAPFLWAWA
ncbi:MAG TPA: hypothetical protein VES42_22440 [Pilimelia sp.]|nr:hypothetical protein [Pilimelia sp.]